MFEITGTDVSGLNDVDLRTLVIKLCEAELRRLELPVSALTAGGDQNAADGGLDVRVALESICKTTDFIIRPDTGFQVKVPDMPPRAIIDEMCPGGILRPVIQDLARKQGAYIIVSSKGSTSDSSLQKRLTAMRDAVASLPDPSILHTDFYDRERLATWVCQYLGIANWVRKQLGWPMQGWQPYCNWSARPGQTDTGYLTDGKSRVYDRRGSKGEGLTAEEGINRIREKLAKLGSAVRLVGLSGVGKTRLVEALFDPKMGENPLDPAIVVYTDIADKPTPSPRDLIQDCIQSSRRAIVVVDNCNPSTHRALIQANAATGSSVSLLTVEFDVGEDEPEDTDVFRLETASEDVIEQLITRAEPHISKVNIRRIAEFSGGNARIALAVAKRVHHSESVGELSDEELFKRLFYQRRPEDASLLRAGEACSLVYSFDGETPEGEKAELPILAGLARLSVEELFRNVQELKGRDLVQQRSAWRAVLPHVLANKLAERALERLMPHTITSVLVDRAPKRLLRSFSRRLGYLHQCSAAQRIVGEWLTEGGLLGQVDKLNALEWAMFRNVAPVSPEAALAALERALHGPNESKIADPYGSNRYETMTLIASLAFDAVLFERASLLLARFFAVEQKNNNTNSVFDLFKGLFQLYLSGTHASVHQRLQTVDRLLAATDDRSQELGLAALNQMLEAVHFSSCHDFEFGARSRDYGWHPKSNGEDADWYRAVLTFALEKFTTENNLASQLSLLIASKFRGLWVRARMHDELEMATATILEQGCWTEGWINVRTTLKFDSSGMAENDIKRLQAIEALLRPANLLDQTRAYVLSPRGGTFDIADGEGNDDHDDLEAADRTVDEKAEELGRKLAAETDSLNRFLPEVMQGEGNGRQDRFGIGLAEGAPNLEEMWQKLKAAFASSPAQGRNCAVLCGFLTGSSRVKPEMVTSILDAAVNDGVLGRIFLYLQCAVDIDERGVQRLLDSLRAGLAPVRTYRALFYGRATGSIPPAKLQRFLLELSHLPDGISVAIDILYMKFFSMKKDGLPVAAELVECGRELLLRYDFTTMNSHDGNHIKIVLKVCLNGPDGEVFAQAICSKLADNIAENRISHDFFGIITKLFQVFPKMALSSFVLLEHGRVLRALSVPLSSNDRPPLEEVPIDMLIDWANEEPQIRFPALATSSRLFVSSNYNQVGTLSPLAIALVDAAPDKEAVLERLQKHLWESGWVGSYAADLDQKREALAPLMKHADRVVAMKVVEWDMNLAQQADHARSRELKEGERFE